MNRRHLAYLSTAAATAAVSFGAAGTAESSAATTAMQRLGTPAAIPAQAQAVGAVSAQQPVSATVAMAPRDAAALQSFVTAVSTPGSAQFHHYLSVGQFAARFGPSTSSLSTVRSTLRREGLTVGATSPNGLSFTVSGPASTVDRAFSVTLDRYSLPGGQTGYAPSTAPAVPSAIASDVQGVIGLNTLVKAQRMSLMHAHRLSRPAARSASDSASDAVSPCSAATSAASQYGAYTPDQLADAYDFNSVYSGGDTGSGETVALFELEPYLASDISTYQSCMGTDVPVSNTTVDGGSGTGAGEGEAALDIEDVLGLAPGSSIDVYEGPNSSSGVYDTYSAIVSDDTAKVVSTSWGECEASEGSSAASSENTLFQEAASQGQSVFAAAGDSGADDCQNGSSAAVDDPASQPDVTGVGGTSLPSDSDAAGQTVWNDGSGGGAGGGGVSTLWSTPSYQSPFVSGSMREVPDVSADADPETGYVIYYNGSWTAIGGTSAAAPLWAAMTALADNSCGTGIGLANTAIYSAASSNYAGDFDDVTSGNNSYDGVTGFSAGTGYDEASGLGTPNAGSLVPALCG